MSRKRKIYEGKAKILYEGPEHGTIVQYFKDDATADNAKKHAVLDGKGVLNNRISEFIMTKLALAGIPNHFIRRLNMREQLVHQVDIIPIEVVVRNVVAGSLSKRLGIEEGQPLERPLIEFFLKNDDLNDPLVTEDHIIAFNWATNQEIDDIVGTAFRVNDFLAGLFSGIKLRLVDFKLEFGRYYKNETVETMIADEISPDSCRLWDFDTGEKMDKDRFRRDLGGVTEAYTEVAKRFGLINESPQAGQVLQFDRSKK